MAVSMNYLTRITTFSKNEIISNLLLACLRLWDPRHHHAEPSSLKKTMKYKKSISTMQGSISRKDQDLTSLPMKADWLGKPS